jgi:hypothetical protein
MTETLLSPGNVLLFGRRVEDLKIDTPTKALPAAARRIDVQAATTTNLPNLADHLLIDGVQLNASGQHVLVKDQEDANKNGVWTTAAAGAANNWTRHADADTDDDFKGGMLVKVTAGTKNANTWWELRKFRVLNNSRIKFGRLGRVDGDGYKDPRHGPFAEDRTGEIGDVERQLKLGESCFARIYGFSYEGTYYELPRPALFLVHGEGTDIAEEFGGRMRTAATRARALGDPSLTGLAAADFQFAEDLRVWSYDKADYTIRMDVETGMFEDVLLDIVGGGGPGASGARVSGARVSGARVSGARVSGARLSGGRGDAGD